MTFFQFMNDHPVISFFMLWTICQFLFNSWNRFLRHLNIRKHGWPPAHCDDDGDFKPGPEDESRQTGESV